MVTIPDVEQWDVAVLQRVLDAAKGSGASLQRLGDGLDGTKKGLADWKGQAAQAWQQEHGKIRTDITEQHTETQQVAKIINPAIDDVRWCVNELKDARTAPEALGMKINPDGSVTDPQQGKSQDKQAGEQREHVRVNAQQRLQALLSKATATDTEVANALRAAVNDTPLPVASGAPHAPAGTTPAQAGGVDPKQKSLQDTLFAGIGGDPATGKPATTRPSDALTGVLDHLPDGKPDAGSADGQPGKTPTPPDRSVGSLQANLAALSKPDPNDPRQLPAPTPNLNGPGGKAAVDQVRQYLLSKGVAPAEVERQLNGVLAQQPRAMYSAPDPAPEAPHKETFSDAFHDSWDQGVHGIQDLVGAGDKGLAGVPNTWKNVADGLGHQLTHPWEQPVQDAKDLINNPKGFLGHQSAIAAQTLPGLMFGGEGALARTGLEDAALSDAHHAMVDGATHPHAPSTIEHTTPVGGDTGLHDPLPDLSHFPDTGHYQLPDRTELTTPKDGAFFWSGRNEDNMGIGPLSAGGNGAADLISGGSHATTLEGLLESNGIQPPKWSPNDIHADNWWSSVSQMYAGNASGEVHAVVGSNLRPGNIWENVELPRLMENPNITKVIVINPDTGIETTVFQR